MKRHDTPTASGRLPAALLLLLLALSGPPLRSYTVVTNPLAVTLDAMHGNDNVLYVTRTRPAGQGGAPVAFDALSVAVGWTFRLYISGGLDAEFSPDDEYCRGECGYGYWWPECLANAGVRTCGHALHYGLDADQCRQENSQYLWYSLDGGAAPPEPMPPAYYTTMVEDASGPYSPLPGGHSVTLGFHNAFCIHGRNDMGFGHCHEVIRPHHEAAQPVNVVRMGSVSGPDGFSTYKVDSGENGYVRGFSEEDWLSLPLGGPNSTAVFTAAPYPAAAWPPGTPSWRPPAAPAQSSVDPDDRTRITVRTNTAFAGSLRAECGTSFISMGLNVVEVDGIETAVVARNGDPAAAWNAQGGYPGPSSGPLQYAGLADTADGKLLVVRAQDAWLSLLAVPNPRLGESVPAAEAKLPGAWEFTGGEAATPKMVRKLDLSVPGVTEFTARCGVSVKKLTVVVGNFDLQTDSNGDSYITQSDDPVEMDSPGRIAIANDGDADGDGIIDNTDMQIVPENQANQNLFTEVRLEITNLVHGDNVRIHFLYDAASAADQQGQNQFGGTLRLWKKQSHVIRNPLPVKDGGEYIIPDTSIDDTGYTPEQLGMQFSSTPLTGTSWQLGSGTTTFWLEGVAPAQNQVIQAWASSSSSMSASNTQDAIKVSVISLSPGLVQASLTGGGSVPNERKMTFGLPLVVNDDHDGFMDDNHAQSIPKDCGDSIVNGDSDLVDMGLLTFSALPSFMPPTGTVQLSFSSSNLKFFENNDNHAFAGSGSLNLSATELYSRLKQGNLAYHVESTAPGTVTVAMGVNHSPPRPVAILRSIQMPREFVTHDPDFEIIAGNSLLDDFRQRELMDHVAEIVIPVLPSGHGQLRARIVETHMFNETMGWVDLGSNGTLCLKLWKRFREDSWPDAQNYHQVWLEASTSGLGGSYTPLADDWSYTNRDIIIEIYHNNDKLTQLPIKLKSLMTLSYPNIEIIGNMASPVIFNPYASDADMEFDFHLFNVFEDAQQGYGLRIEYQLSETVIAGGNGTDGNFFVIQDIDGDVGTHIPSVDQNLLLKSSRIMSLFHMGPVIKWEGFTQTISGEDASAIWMFPIEGKDNNEFASPANVAKEGKYKITLGCTDRFYTNQKQTIQFAAEVNYDFE